MEVNEQRNYEVQQRYNLKAPGKMRVAAGIEYIGTAYHGWQLQEKSPTIQAYVEHALTRVANYPIQTICAGRTDAGVHAFEQVVHFDTPVERSEYSWLCGTNQYLPRDISFQWVKFVPEEFDARFSALGRRYCYVIYFGKARPALLARRVMWKVGNFDVELMQQAANELLGEHDFSSFRARYCQSKSPIRTIYEINISQHQQFIVINIFANAFLHHMVRNIVGVLVEIGQKKKSVEWIKEVLAARDRSAASATITANGLYLAHITYPVKYSLPKRSFSLIDLLF